MSNCIAYLVPGTTCTGTRYIFATIVMVVPYNYKRCQFYWIFATFSLTWYLIHSHCYVTLLSVRFLRCTEGKKSFWGGLMFLRSVTFSFLYFVFLFYCIFCFVLSGYDETVWGSQNWFLEMIDYFYGCPHGMGRLFFTFNFFISTIAVVETLSTIYRSGKRKE